MAEERSALEVWLDFAKTLIWPLFLFAVFLLLRVQLRDLMGRVTDVNATPTGLSFKVQAKQEKTALQNTITSEAQPAASTDPAPSAQAKSQIQRLAALQTITETAPTSTKIGWIYCGRFSHGKWAKPPNLKASGPIEENKTYRVATDTYLRDSPPEGSNPKGQVIGIVPEGQDVKVLKVSQVPDKEQAEPDSSLVWVEIENKDFYAMSRGH